VLRSNLFLPNLTAQFYLLLFKITNSIFEFLRLVFLRVIVWLSQLFHLPAAFNPNLAMTGMVTLFKNLAKFGFKGRQLLGLYHDGFPSQAKLVTGC
jgi:hypothetical protein